MKIYLLFSTLSFILISFLIDLMMSNNPGFTTYAGFNGLLSTHLFSVKNTIIWGIEGLALSFAAYLYVMPKTALSDGFRFGLITGLMFVLILLFNMMFQYDYSNYPFFSDSLLPLVILQLIGFAVNGWIFGLMFELFSTNQKYTIRIWSIA
ncbi:hypothetical protein OS175_02595 [Marinicella sp. S1101]|uniref:hypothetical protein n=1 Tax=Marinicella marina TaxID=2996016 RepID=UPI002260B0A8|nr:hypothetical protein [Marinicella marina]MCX7552755.1 hypothetical protein [Marinicella marina]MDJ1139936.1 hypothetical protein [Marinicella marina]